MAGICLAALVTSSPISHSQEVPGQSAFNRGSEQRAHSLARSSPATQRRTHLIGEVVTRPTIVQAAVGTTIVAGTTSINAGTIAAAGDAATAAQLDVRCPAGGGRVVLHGNRVINFGDIVADGNDATAAQVIKRCDSRINGTSSTTQTRFDNYGRIRAVP